MILIDSVSGERVSVPPERECYLRRRICRLAELVMYDSVSGDHLSESSTSAILIGDSASNADVASLTGVATMRKIIEANSTAHSNGGPFVPLLERGYIYLPEERNGKH